MQKELERKINIAFFHHNLKKVAGFNAYSVFRRYKRISYQRQTHFVN